MSDRPVYVYGIVAADQAGRFSTSGVEAASVRVISHDEVGALVSDLEHGALSAAREVRAHWRVLEEVLARTTVLPVRFGTVLENDRAVREELLVPNADRLSGRLRDLADHVEMTLKGSYAEERLLRGIVASSPAVAALRTRLRDLPDNSGYHERIRLGELIAAEVERQRERDTADALAWLDPVATALRAQAVGLPDHAFNIALLVERARLDEVSAAVGELREHLGDRVDLRYIGPLPPYSFVDAELVAGRS